MHFAQEENNMELIHLFQSRYPKIGDLLNEVRSVFGSSMRVY